jgi:endonuclease I
MIGLAPPVGRVVNQIERVTMSNEVPGFPEARARLQGARSRPYYDAAEDETARQAYYRDVAIDGQSPEQRYRVLGSLLRRTHTTILSYSDARQQHLYPVVDLHPDGKLRSIYTQEVYEPEEILRHDFQMTQAVRSEAFRTFGSTPERERFVHEHLELLEASAAYNAEHIVPQSWFAKRSPMKSDLHHLFTCEIVCNNFRANTPYVEFPDFAREDRIGCGRSTEKGFEPAFGHGPAARATLYFLLLLRYPSEINDSRKEYTSDRLVDLLGWHHRDPVTDHERHRNAEIQRVQGNRNPLIDVPEWADQIDFSQGLGM